jgi:hypothetical protein
VYRTTSTRIAIHAHIARLAVARRADVTTFSVLSRVPHPPALLLSLLFLIILLSSTQPSLFSDCSFSSLSLPSSSFSHCHRPHYRLRRGFVRNRFHYHYHPFPTPLPPPVILFCLPPVCLSHPPSPPPRQPPPSPSCICGATLSGEAQCIVWTISRTSVLWVSLVMRCFGSWPHRSPPRNILGKKKSRPARPSLNLATYSCMPKEH